MVACKRNNHLTAATTRISAKIRNKEENRNEIRRVEEVLVPAKNRKKTHDVAQITINKTTEETFK